MGKQKVASMLTAWNNVPVKSCIKGALNVNTKIGKVCPYLRCVTSTWLRFACIN